MNQSAEVSGLCLECLTACGLLMVAGQSRNCGCMSVYAFIASTLMIDCYRGPLGWKSTLAILKVSFYIFG